MLSLFNGERLGKRLKFNIKVVVAILSGSCFGYLYGRRDWQSKKDFCNDQKLIEYESEDQINSMIQKTGKPAVIYYYLPRTKYHFKFRWYMFKYSHLGCQNANWFMVNLTKHFGMAKEALRQITFPRYDARIEVRFPKKELAIFQKNGKTGQLNLIREILGNRRQVYYYENSQQQFEAFLQENGVIAGKDPLKPVLQITKKALFS